jgi:hypothetical protein
MPDKFLSGTYSRSAAQETFNRLRRRFSGGSWLGAQNRYAKKCVEKIHEDCKNPAPRHRITGARESQLAEYIAASAPLHCVDGWSFLGKALLSHAMGNAEAAKHFAYYAQLRAVMSLLASEGIGIFNDRHFSIRNANGRSSGLNGPINSNTHKLVREQFIEWVNHADSGKLFQEIIRPRGMSLAIWFSEISTQQLNYLATDWLKQWGYDITTLGIDQSAREHASYRPSSIEKDLSFKNATQIRSSLGIVENIWHMCAIGGAGGFVVDSYLLRLSWEKHLGRRLIQGEVRRTLENLGINQPELSTLTQLFSRMTQRQDPMLIIEAGKKGKPSNPDYHIQMMARATLLLRLATGSGTKMIENAHFSKADLKFWWENLGENYGLWEPGQVDPISDMWAEVEAALGSMGGGSASINDHYKWRTILAAELLTLSGCERIPLSQFCL